MQNVLLTGPARELQEISQKDKGGYSLRMVACRRAKRQQASQREVSLVKSVCTHIGGVGWGGSMKDHEAGPVFLMYGIERGVCISWMET